MNSSHDMESTPKGYYETRARAEHSISHYDEGFFSKQKRFRPTDDQLQTLEQYFEKNVFIGPIEAELLSKKLNIPIKTLRLWFQNRRAKERRKQQIINAFKMKSAIATAQSQDNVLDILEQFKNGGGDNFVNTTTNNTNKLASVSSLSFQGSESNNYYNGPADLGYITNINSSHSSTHSSPSIISTELSKENVGNIVLQHQQVKDNVEEITKNKMSLNTLLS